MTTSIIENTLTQKDLYLVSIMEFEKDYDEYRHWINPRRTNDGVMEKINERDQSLEKILYLYFSNGESIFRIKMYFFHFSHDDTTDFGSIIEETTWDNFFSMSSPLRTVFELYEPKKIYMVPQDEYNHTVLVTIPDYSSSNYKLAQDNSVHYDEDIGYKYNYLRGIRAKYKLQFSPTYRFFRSVGTTVQKQLFTILHIASRGHQLEIIEKLKDTDLWLPIEMWYMIFKFFY